MFKTNEYFEGKVKSISFAAPGCPATLGVMAPGDYEFGTTSEEHMTVVSGKLTVLLPQAITWKDYRPFETFIVPKDQRFKLKVEQDTAYICLYK